MVLNLWTPIECGDHLESGEKSPQLRVAEECPDQGGGYL